MYHIRLTLVLWIFALTAIPTQAAQVCEAEIRAIEETVKAGGNSGIQGFRERGANIRQNAIKDIEYSTKDPTLCGDTFYPKHIAKTEDSIRRIETLIKNGGEQRADGSRPYPGAVGSVEYYKKLLLDARASLAVLKFKMCVYAKTCYTPKGALSTPTPN